MLEQSIFAVHTCSRLVRRYRLTIQSRLLITVLVSRLEDTDTRQGSICQRFAIMKTRHSSFYRMCSLCGQNFSFQSPGIPFISGGAYIPYELLSRRDLLNGHIDAYSEFVFFSHISAHQFQFILVTKLSPSPLQSVRGENFTIRERRSLSFNGCY